MKTLFVAFRCFFVLTLLTGAIYPVLVTWLGQAFFASKANGSLVYSEEGKLLGSELIAQGFESQEYFWPRPSAIGYNPLPSGGTNLGPTSKALQEKWEERRKAGLSGDMLAASASGLDPHISPASAAAQVGRVAKARGKTEEEISKILASAVERPQLGFLGQSRVNVVKLNLMLDKVVR